MRSFLLLVALLLPTWALAQPDPDATRPTTFDNPEAVFSAIGRAWADLEADTPLPDSGAVVSGNGSVRWLTTNNEVQWIQADIRNGRVVQFAVRPSPEVKSKSLTDFARELGQELGRPAPNGYHDATNWSEFKLAIDSSPDADLKIQIAMFVADRIMVIRLTPGSRP